MKSQRQADTPEDRREGFRFHQRVKELEGRSLTFVRHVNFGIQFGCTLRADTMTELGFGMLANVLLYSFPIAGIVSDLLAMGANREKT